MQICTELWPSRLSEHLYFLLANLILCYLGPLCVISFCYIIIWKSVANRNIPGEYLGYQSTRDAINKSRLKVTKMVFVVIITFALSWLPLYSIFCIVKFWEEILYDEQGERIHLKFILNFSITARPFNWIKFHHVHNTAYWDIVLPCGTLFPSQRSCIFPRTFGAMVNDFS